jgi:predicted ATPase
MQSLSPTSRYLLALKEGSHQPDDVQQEAVSRLDTIYQELQNKPAPAPQSGGLRANSASGWVSANLPSSLQRCAACMWGASGEENLADGPVLS